MAINSPTGNGDHSRRRSRQRSWQHGAAARSRLDALCDHTLPAGPNTGDLDAGNLDARDLDTHERTGPTAQAPAPLHQALTRQAASTTEPPAGFIESVMNAVRAQPHSSATLRLPSAPTGRLAITEHAAASLLSIAADTAGGATSRGCRFPHPDDPTHLHISISLDYRQPAHPTADHLRATLRAAAHAQLGLHLTSIDITIDDVHPCPCKD